MRKLLKILSTGLVLGLFWAVFAVPARAVSDLTVGSLTAEKSLYVQGRMLQFQNAWYDPAPTVDFGRGSSRIYDSGDLRVTTDDKLYFETPDSFFTGDVWVQGSDINLNGGSWPNLKHPAIYFQQGGSMLYDNADLHIGTDDYLYLDAPTATVLSGGLTVSGASNVAALTASSLDAGSGLIQTTGNIAGLVITASTGVTGGGYANFGATTITTLTASGLSSLSGVNAGAATASTLSATGLATLASLNVGAATASSLTVSGTYAPANINTSAITGTTISATTLLSGLAANFGATTTSTLSSTGAASLASINAGGITGTALVSSGSVTGTTLSATTLGSLATLSAGVATVSTLSATGLATLASLNVGAATASSLTVSGTYAPANINTGNITGTTISATTLLSGLAANFGATTASTLSSTGLATLASVNAGAITGTAVDAGSGVIQTSGNIAGAIITASTGVLGGGYANFAATTVSTLTASGLSSLTGVNAGATTATTLSTTGTATLNAINAGVITGTTISATTLGSLAALNAGASTITTLTASGAVNIASTLDVVGDITAGGGFKHAVGTWYQYNVAASQSAVAMGLAGTLDATNGTTHQVTEIRLPYAGSVVGISVVSNAARTAGTLTVDATINGTATGLQAVLDASNTLYHSATQAKGTDAFSAGNRVGVKITTDASWAPTTADIVVVVWVEM